MANSMQRNTRVPRDQWLQFFDRLARDNQGRPIRLETSGGEPGAEQIGRVLPLLSINYDRAAKGNVLTISTGAKEIEYEHAVTMPKEIWVEEHGNGRGKAIEIVSEGGERTVMSFEQ
jgi:hypothetical protein